MSRRINEELIMSLGYFGGGSGGGGGGGGGGVTAYSGLTGKPKINDTEVLNDQTLEYYQKIAVKLCDVANWSATTTTIEGVAYYTNVMSFTKIHANHPDVNIAPTGSAVLPTAAERKAFGQIATTGYMVASGNNITAYSQEKPTSSFSIIVKGAEA